MICTMKKMSFFPLLVGATLLKSRHSNRSHDCEPSTSSSTNSRKDIVETALSAGAFKTLIQAILAGDLEQTLKGTGPFTVFAPMDEAFGKLPEGALQDLMKPENQSKLVSVLTYHVIPARFKASDLMESPDVISARSLRTVNGQTVTARVENGRVQIDSAKVTQADILCSNGVIHVIDSVLLPKE